MSRAVGNKGTRLSTGVQLNGQPYGYSTRPENLDPTNTQGGVPRPKADNFLRPMRGFAGISQRQYHGQDLFHSIQVGVTRRATSFTFGLSYTGSIRRSLGAKDPFVSETENWERFWTASGSRPHNLTINYSWEVPSASQHWDNWFSKSVLDGWQISGVTTMLSGTRGGPGIAFSGVPNNVVVTNGSVGGSFGMRPHLACDPNLPRDERTFERQFNWQCVLPPTDRYLLRDIARRRADEPRLHQP